VSLADFDRLVGIVNDVLKTGRIKGENAMGCMVIAPPEHGKSEKILELFADDPSVSWCNDLSSNPLITKILPEIEANRITHIVIPDFLKILSHGKKTTMSLLTNLNSLTAEGIKAINFFGVERTFSRPIKAGVVMAITQEAFARRKQYWREIGFLSRCPPVSYQYSKETMKLIHLKIENGDYSKTERIRLPKRARKIGMSHAHSKTINELQEKWRSKLGSYTGFRFHKQLRVLAKAIAYDDGTVQDRHIEKLRDYLTFMNFDYTVI
jgi:hypothetical protein